MSVEKEIASAKAKLAALESRAKEAASGLLKNDRLKDRRLWTVLLMIPLLILLNHYGFGAVLLERIFDLAIVLIVAHTLSGVVRDIMNGMIAVERARGLAKEGKLPDTTKITLTD